MYLLHTEWTAPLGLSAAVWGVITLIGYLVFVQVARTDKSS